MNEKYKSINNLWKDSEGYRYFGALKLSSKIKYDGDDFIPLWEWINKLQQENKQLKERYSKLEEKYFANVPCCNENDCDLYRDYIKLKDNWNKLKEIAQSQSDFKLKCKNKKLWFEVDELLDKMQELEKGSDNQ